MAINYVSKYYDDTNGLNFVFKADPACKYFFFKNVGGTPIQIGFGSDNTSTDTLTLQSWETFAPFVAPASEFFVYLSIAGGAFTLLKEDHTHVVS